MNGHPTHLFVYGTLQHPHVWREVVKGEYQQEHAILQDYQACVVKGAVYPGLISKDGCFARGIIYFDINNEDIIRLDAFEGNQYKRVEVYPSIHHDDKVKCDTYLFIGKSSILTGEIWSFEKYILEGHDRFVSGYKGWRKLK